MLYLVIFVYCAIVCYETFFVKDYGATEIIKLEIGSRDVES